MDVEYKVSKFEVVVVAVYKEVIMETEGRNLALIFTYSQTILT